MTSMAAMPVWLEGEETLNACSHAVGIGLSLCFIKDSILSYQKDKNLRSFIGKIIFSISSLILYTNSTIYHGLPQCDLKVTFRFIDHITIYILIIGSYAPVALSIVGGKLGLGIFGFVLVCGIIGAYLKLVYFDKFFYYSLVLYLLMGWSAAIALPKILKSNPRLLFWVVLGGLSYSIGVYFFYHKRPFYHFIFHLFILGGTICHAVGIIGCQ